MDQLQQMMQSMQSGMKDALADAWCQTALEFIGKLADIYPQQRLLLLTKQQELALAMGNGNGADVMMAFCSVAEPYAEQIATRNEQYMLEDAKKLNLIDGFDLSATWNDTPAQTKNAIWAYVGKLLHIAMQAKITQQQQQAPGMPDWATLTTAAMQAEEEFRQQNNGRSPETWDEIRQLAARVAERQMPSKH